MRIAFIGLGEAASAFIGGWGDGRAPDIAAYDIKSRDPATAPEIAARANALSVQAFDTPQAALDGAGVVFCTVTADQAVAAAETCAPSLGADTVWCDLNSCAPASKRRAAAVIEAAGGRYLDVAVMAPVYPARNRVPCLVSGPQAGDLAPTLEALPMNVHVVGDEVGRASSIKLVRSILVKGLEALTAECALAAVAAGVGDDVFPSLRDGHPGIDLPARAAYNFGRSLTHGVRRGAEMDEAARMLADLGLPAHMSLGSARWQEALAATGAAPDMTGDEAHIDYALAILRKLGVGER